MPTVSDGYYVALIQTCDGLATWSYASAMRFLRAAVGDAIRDTEVPEQSGLAREECFQRESASGLC